MSASASRADRATVVWLASPEQMPVGLARRWLAREEQARLARFVVPAAARTFAASRTLLRMVAEQHGAEPVWASSGAPRLANASGLSVSASGTRGLVAVAVTQGPRVGIDVERIRARPLGGPLPAAALSPAELELLRRHHSERVVLFFRLWTRKEALMKAAGRSLRMTGLDVAWHGVSGRVELPEATVDVRDLNVDPCFAVALVAERVAGPTVHADAWSTLEADDP
jgi:4'-phosphopantetheinyl transferase